MLFKNYRIALIPLVMALLILIFFALTVRPQANALNSATQLTSSTADIVTATPFTPYIQLFPDCGVPPYVEFTIRGANWNPGEVDLSWDGEFLENSSRPFVNTEWRIANLLPGVYTVLADNGVAQFAADFTVSGDCIIPTATLQPTTTPFATFTPGPTVTPFATMTPVATATAEPPGSATFTPTGPVPTDPVPTATPPPGTLGPDLVILAVEPLITAPLQEYTPIYFRVEIANESPVSILSQFFFDIFLDPNPFNITPTSIPLRSSSGYMAVSSLSAGSSRVITVVAEYGFVSNGTVSGMRRVYGMVDSADSIAETVSGETNNLLGPIYVANVTPGPTRTLTATPATPNGAISGVIFSNLGGWHEQFRAEVFVVEAGAKTIVSRTMTAENGTYLVSHLPTGSGQAYDVYACLEIDSELILGGVRNLIVPPSGFVDVYMVEQSAGCPQPDLQSIYQQFFPVAQYKP